MIMEEPRQCGEHAMLVDSYEYHGAIWPGSCPISRDGPCYAPGGEQCDYAKQLHAVADGTWQVCCYPWPTQVELAIAEGKQGKVKVEESIPVDVAGGVSGGISGRNKSISAPSTGTAPPPG